jgi:branched-chain amino acid transport system permease protein
LLGLPVLRLRGDYLAIVTLGFGEMIRILARNSDSVGNPPVNLTNGAQGLNNVGRPLIPDILRNIVTGAGQSLNVPVVNIQPLIQQLLFYLIAIAAIVLIIIIARRLENSPIGRAWTAIREDEVAAIAMGVPLVRMKLLAFAMGAAFAGAFGVIYAAKQTFVSPESFSLIQSISILAMVIVGGIGSIRGVLLGACVVTLLNLQVLKNLSLQINAWRNNDAVLPQSIIVVVAALVLLLLLWIAWRTVSRARLERSDRSRYSGFTLAAFIAVVGIVILVTALSGGDFHLRDWPPQLEPAKYERLVFGVLLITMMIFRPAGLLPENRRRMEIEVSKAAQEAVPQVGAGGD